MATTKAAIAFTGFISGSSLGPPNGWP